MRSFKILTVAVLAATLGACTTMTEQLSNITLSNGELAKQTARTLEYPESPSKIVVSDRTSADMWVKWTATFPSGKRFKCAINYTMGLTQATNCEPESVVKKAQF